MDLFAGVHPNRGKYPPFRRLALEAHAHLATRTILASTGSWA